MMSVIKVWEEGQLLTCHSSWSFGCTPYAADVEASGLSGEVRASSHGAHFNGRHGDAHVQTLAVLWERRKEGEERRGNIQWERTSLLRSITYALGVISLTSAYSMMVMQLLLSTFCAGSWPVARNTAVTMFAACALNPPIDPVRVY